MKKARNLDLARYSGAVEACTELECLAVALRHWARGMEGAQERARGRAERFLSSTAGRVVYQAIQDLTRNAKEDTDG